MIQKSSKAYEERFKQEVSTILKYNKNRCISFGELTGILADHEIKFFSKDQLSKINKLFPSTFHTVPLHQILTYLELSCMHWIRQSKTYVVKVRGRMIDKGTENAIGKRKTETHHIHFCIKMLKNLLTKMYGKETFWFRALGGIANTNSIKVPIFQSKILKLLKNSSHSSCVQRLFSYLSGGYSENPQNMYDQVSWELIRRRLNPLSPLNNSLSTVEGKSEYLRSKSINSQESESIKITSFQSIQDFNEKEDISGLRYKKQVKGMRGRNILRTSNNFRGVGKQQYGRVRATSLLSTHVCRASPINLELKETVIHSNSVMHEKLFGDKKKSRSSCKYYQYYP